MKDSLIDLLLYLPVNLFLWLVRILPLGILLWLGNSLGLLMYHISPKRVRVCRINLKAAYGQRLTPGKREKIIKAIFKNFGLNFMELFLMPRMDDKYFSKFTRVKHEERIAEALKKGNGLVFLSAHYGNWEVCASISAHHGYKMLALARVQKPLFLNEILNKYRESRGTTVIQKGFQVREIVRHLKTNGIVGFIGDQSGRQGVEVDLFGRPIFVADGVFRISANTKSVILPAFNMRRGKGFNHELIVEKPIEPLPGEGADEFARRGVAEYTALLEKYIRKHPHLWLWGNRRWKHTRSRTVLILKDGKTGHFRQAQAVAAAIKARTEPVKVVEIDLEYRNDLCEKLGLFLVLNFIDLIPDPAGLLRFLLKPDCGKKLDRQFCDVIICSGSLTRPAALLLGKENLAKVISVMKPAPFSSDQFDLSIIPAHDRPKKNKRVLVTAGALNLITPRYLEESLRKLKENVRLAPGAKIGVIIGGDSRDYVLRPEITRTVLRQVKEFAEKYALEIMLTTSRRTSALIDRLIADELKGYPRCVFKVFPNEKNYDYALSGILGACDYLVVSGESISMISEAAAAGRNTVVFRLDLKNKRKIPKHELFLGNLSRNNYIMLTDADRIFAALVSLKEEKKGLRGLDERDELDQAVKKLIGR